MLEGTNRSCISQSSKAAPGDVLRASERLYTRPMGKGGGATWSTEATIQELEQSPSRGYKVPIS